MGGLLITALGENLEKDKLELKETLGMIMECRARQK